MSILAELKADIFIILHLLRLLLGCLKTDISCLIEFGLDLEI